MRQRKLFDDPAAVLDYEFGQEKASALGRVGRALEQALATLAAFDADHAACETPPAPVRQTRSRLVSEASLALWHFVVQREACGLRDLRQLLRDYRVPPEVAARMGAWPGASGRPRR
ncbi:MAG: DUF6665 family protein [Pseudorhodoplanes sp.]